MGYWQTDMFGTRKYIDRGKVHKIDGPAEIYKDGTLIYRKHGNLHREDGPAVEYPSGRKMYYLDGNPITAEELLKRAPKNKRLRLLYNLDRILE